MSEQSYEACQSCGSIQVHLIGVEILHAGTKNGSVQVDSEGVTVLPDGAGSDGGRGVKAKLMFQCENCPTLFTKIYAFHKGSVQIDYEFSCIDGYESMEEMPAIQTIWRD